jgi:hypothetical protein
VYVPLSNDLHAEWPGRTVAACSPTRVFLADELEHVDEADADRRFVLVMCLYAGHVAHGHLPGPYSDQAARRFAWARLIPAELLERPVLDVARAARGLGVPARELAAAREIHVAAADLAARHDPRPLRS